MSVVENQRPVVTEVLAFFFHEFSQYLMAKVCLVCNLEVISTFQQPRSVDIMLEYVLGCQKKINGYLCETCYTELKVAFDFKKKFHQSRRSKLKRLRRDRAAIESEHNYYVQPPAKKPAFSRIPKVQQIQKKTGAKKESKISTVLKKTKKVKCVARNLNSDNISCEKKPPDLDDTVADKKNEQKNSVPDLTAEQNELMCSWDVSKVKIEVEDELEDDHKINDIKKEEFTDDIKKEEFTDDIKKEEFTDDIKKEEFTDVEYLECDEEPHTEEVFYIVELLEPAEEAGLSDFPNDGTDKENKNQDKLTNENQEFRLKEKGATKPIKKMLNLNFEEHDLLGKLKKTQCRFCFHIFSNFKELAKHKQYHQKEERPFRCPNCTYRFKNWISLQRHYLIKHKGTNVDISERFHIGRSPWICADCGRAFALKEVFDTHIRNHNREQNFECRHCFKSFATKTNLQIHLRIHTKGSPFECHQCGRCFISFTRLEVHKRLHTGFRPFQCEVCDAAFINSSGLIKHWRVYSHFRGAIKSPSDPELLNNK